MFFELLAALLQGVRNTIGLGQSPLRQEKYVTIYSAVTVAAHLVIAIGLPIQFQVDGNLTSAQTVEASVVIPVFVLAGLMNLGFRIPNVDSVTQGPFIKSVVRYVQLVSLLDILGLAALVGYDVEVNKKLWLVLAPIMTFAAVDIFADSLNFSFIKNITGMEALDMRDQHGKAGLSAGLLLAVGLLGSYDDDLSVPSYATLTPSFGAISLLFFLALFAEQGQIKRIHDQTRDVESGAIGTILEVLVLLASPFFFTALAGSGQFLDNFSDIWLPLSVLIVGSLTVSIILDNGGLDAACLGQIPAKLGSVGFAFSLYAISAYIVYGTTGGDKIGIVSLWNGQQRGYIPGQLLFLTSAIFASVGLKEDGSPATIDTSILHLNEEKNPLVKNTGSSLRRSRNMVEGRLIV